MSVTGSGPCSQSPTPSHRETELPGGAHAGSSGCGVIALRRAVPLDGGSKVLQKEVPATL